MEVTITDRDVAEVKIDTGVLTCYRSNVDRQWHAIWLHKPDGDRIAPPSCFTLSQETLDAIAEAEAEQRKPKMQINPEPLEVVAVPTCVTCRKRAPWCSCGKADYRWPDGSAA